MSMSHAALAERNDRLAERAKGNDHLMALRAQAREGIQCCPICGTCDRWMPPAEFDAHVDVCEKLEFATAEAVEPPTPKAPPAKRKPRTPKASD